MQGENGLRQNHQNARSSVLDSETSMLDTSMDESLFSECSARPTHGGAILRHRSMLEHGVVYDRADFVDRIQREAQQTHNMVQDLTSTPTMRRRRHESDTMTIRTRHRSSCRSLNMYTPIAPPDSQWGRMFDEIVARLQGKIHEDNNQQRIKNDFAVDVTSNIDINSSTVEIDKINCTATTVHPTHPTNRFDDLDHTITATNTPDIDIAHKVRVRPDRRDSQEGKLESSSQTSHSGVASMREAHEKISPPELHRKNRDRKIRSTRKLSRTMNTDLIGSKLKRSQTDTNNSRIIPKTDLTRMLRSISLHKPDIAMYNHTFTPLRRTDSDNDVWITMECESKSQTAQQPNPEGPVEQRSIRDKPWNKFRKIFPFLRSKPPKTTDINRQ